MLGGNDLLCGGGQAGDELYGEAGNDIGCAHDTALNMNYGTVAAYDPTFNDEVLLDDGDGDGTSVYSLASVPSGIDATIDPSTAVITFGIVDTAFTGGIMTYRAQRDHPDGTVFSEGNIDVRVPLDVFTVTFDSPGGSAVPDQGVDNGGLVVEPGDPVRTGHTSTEWYTGVGAATIYDFTEPVLADFPLYAGWEEGEPDPGVPGDGGDGGDGSDSGDGRTYDDGGTSDDGGSTPDGDTPPAPGGTGSDPGTTGESTPGNAIGTETIAATDVSLPNAGLLAVLVTLSLGGGLVLVRRQFTHT